MDAIPSIKRPGGGRRKRPLEFYADQAYDAKKKIHKPCEPKGSFQESQEGTPAMEAVWENTVVSSRESSLALPAKKTSGSLREA
jgi:hypothetical protein